MNVPVVLIISSAACGVCARTRPPKGALAPFGSPSDIIWKHSTIGAILFDSERPISECDAAVHTMHGVQSRVIEIYVNDLNASKIKECGEYVVDSGNKFQINRVDLSNDQIPPIHALRHLILRYPMFLFFSVKEWGDALNYRRTLKPIIARPFGATVKVVGYGERAEPIYKLVTRKTQELLKEIHAFLCDPGNSHVKWETVPLEDERIQAWLRSNRYVSDTVQLFEAWC